jgi:hypothetical protein
MRRAKNVSYSVGHWSFCNKISAHLQQRFLSWEPKSEIADEQKRSWLAEENSKKFVSFK